MNSHLRATSSRGKVNSNGGNSVSSTALLAVALQDHWMKNMTSDEIQLGRISKKKLPSLESRLRSKRVPAKAVVDTGRKVSPPKKEVKKEENKEYVLDPKLPPLTLAQKMGLVDAPTSQMSEGDWAVAKAKSNARHDSRFPCVICKEDFGTQQQVLLSCTHVFHRACLEAFERFSGKKCCPMCRKEQYQKRVIHEGAKQFKHISATRIQATWRGYVVRTWYKRLRETVPPKDPSLKKKFYHDKLSSITDRMVRSIDYDVNGFLQELDDNLKHSREIFKHFDTFLKPITEEEWLHIQMKATERSEIDCPICLTKLEDLGWISNKKTKGGKCKTTFNSSSDISKEKSVQKRPKSVGTKGGAGATEGQTDVTEGEIVNSKGDRVPTKGDTTGQKKSSQRAKVLLSCSHVFHNTCLEAFEEFAVGEHRHVCPVCRDHYHKKVLNGDTP